MADVGAVQSAVSPVSDDVELEDILRRSQPGVPEVVIRKDSRSCADPGDPPATDCRGDAGRLCTPAPIATFEVLSDVEESDMDEVTSLEAQTLDSETAVVSTDEFCVERLAQNEADLGLQANGSLQQDIDLTTEYCSENTTEILGVDSELMREEERSRDADDQPITAGVPTLVFEDVDANNAVTVLSSPECLVNNDDDDDDDADKKDDIIDQMWQWTAEHHQGTVL